MRMTALRHRASEKCGGGSVCTSPTHTPSSPAKGRGFHPPSCSFPTDGIVQCSSPRCPRDSSNSMVPTYFFPWYLGKVRKKRQILSCKYSVSLRFLNSGYKYFTWIPCLRWNVLMIFQFVVPWWPWACDAASSECLFAAKYHKKLLPSLWLLRLLHLSLTETDSMSSFSIHLLWSGVVSC